MCIRDRSCPPSTCTGWTHSSRRFCCRNTPEADAGGTTLRTARCNVHSLGPANRRDHKAVRALREQLRNLPTLDPQDPGYRRLCYLRYADDTLLGFAGPKAEAEQIKARLAQF